MYIEIKKEVFIMKVFSLFAVLFGLIVGSVESKENEIAIILGRENNLPAEVLEECEDPYFEGYIQALIDMHYYEHTVIAVVKNRYVYLSNMPKNKMLASSIAAFVRDVPGVKGVEVIDKIPEKEKKIREAYAKKPQICGAWFPQTTELYFPMIANPRQVIYSFGYRGGDKVIGKKTAAFSMGDNFPIYRWFGVLPWCGDLQVGIETGIWCVFNMDPDPERTDRCGESWAECTECVNTDYYVGIPVSYAVNAWAFRFRLYHISSHIGDEFIFNHPQYIDCDYENTDQFRKNPSMEIIDFFTSYQANKSIRVYGGIGYVLHSDRTFPMDNWYFEYGGEAHFWGCNYHFQKLFGNFFAAAYFRNWEYVNFDLDQTYMFGYEWSKIQGVGRKIRLALEYHDGFSAEGQFMAMRTSYWSFRFIYGF